MLRTPFHPYHLQHGAKLVDFAGWEMPILYKSIIEEHKQVRAAGGLFDVSHMGRLKITGRDARKLIERIATRRVTDMKDFTCRYSLVCNEAGGVLDDILVYRFDDHWMLVVNASNRLKLLAHLQSVAAAESYAANIEDLTLDTAMIALQGPKVIEQIARFSSEVPQLKKYAFCVKNLMLADVTISRTGYTGEDGVEVIMPAKFVEMFIKMVEQSAGEEGKSLLQPVGLGARDTLRLEAGMPLYGHELDEQTDPISAGLVWAVSLNKGEQGSNSPAFIGQEAIRKIATAGPARKLIGLKLEGRRTARQGMAVKLGDTAVGQITSGCLSPTLGYPIAMAYVDAVLAGVGTSLTIDISGTATPAQVVPLPFYKRT